MLIQSELIEFHYCTEPSEVMELVDILQEVNEIGLDTETYRLPEYGPGQALDPHTSRIRLLQINWAGNSVPYIIDLFTTQETSEFNSLVDYLRRPDVTKIIFNSSFDLKMIRSTLGFWMPGSRCAMVAMQRLGVCTGFKASQLRKNSLLALARDYFGISLDKTEGKSEWGSKYLTQSQLAYAALDVGAPYNTHILGEFRPSTSILIDGYHLIVDTLHKPVPMGYDVARVLDIDQESNIVAAKVEYNGLPVNRKALLIFNKHIQSAYELKKIEVCQALRLPYIQRPEVDDQGNMYIVCVVEEEVNKKLNNSKTLVKLINNVLGEEKLDNAQSKTLEALLKELDVKVNQALEYESQVEEVSDSEVQGLQDNLESTILSWNKKVVEDVIEYKRLFKSIGTNYLHVINPVTGRIHAGTRVIGASTGRMSSSGDINCQQIPTKKYKIDYVPPEEFLLNV